MSGLNPIESTEQSAPLEEERGVQTRSTQRRADARRGAFSRLLSSHGDDKSKATSLQAKPAAEGPSRSRPLESGAPADTAPIDLTPAHGAPPDPPSINQERAASIQVTAANTRPPQGIHDGLQLLDAAAEKIGATEELVEDLVDFATLGRAPDGRSELLIGLKAGVFGGAKLRVQANGRNRVRLVLSGELNPSEQARLLSRLRTALEARGLTVDLG